MSWNAFHRRGETLRVVVDHANERRDGVLPMGVPGVAENFTDELDLVGALLLKWHARLSGNIERALARQPMDLEGAVASAWQTTAEELPGVRLVIDQCLDDPGRPEMEHAMQRAREAAWVRLAAAAGLASGRGPAAVAAGRRVEERARLGLAAAAAPETAERALSGAPVDAERSRSASSLADRIRALLAA
jgi:hypothetical protein